MVLLVNERSAKVRPSVSKFEYRHLHHHLPSKKTGKLRAYNVGKVLRKRYNGFLDEEYNIDLIDARSTYYNRTKASLQVMLAGLFPPTKDLVWLEGFNWQPIPFTYAEENLDKEFYCFRCPTWLTEFRAYLTTEEGVKLLSPLDGLFRDVKENTGKDYDFIDLNPLFIGFNMLEEMNLTLPEWAPKVYPYPLETVPLIYYDVMVATKSMRHMSAGNLLKKFLVDAHAKIDGKIPEKKMSIWCGHEANIATFLSIMNIWERKRVPSYGSYILMELHKIDEIYGFKIYYSDNQSEPQLLKLPECSTFCPLDHFEALMKEDIPEGEVCGPASSTRLYGLHWLIFVLQSFNILNTLYS